MSLVVCGIADWSRSPSCELQVRMTISSRGSIPARPTGFLRPGGADVEQELDDEAATGSQGVPVALPVREGSSGGSCGTAANGARCVLRCPGRVRLPVHRRRAPRTRPAGGREPSRSAVLAAADLVGVRQKVGLDRKAGPPVHDDLVEWKFAATAPDVYLADRHHRAPHHRGQAVPLRDQGRLPRPDRRLLHRLEDEGVASGGRRCVTPSFDGTRSALWSTPTAAVNLQSNAFIHTIKNNRLVGSIGSVGACGDNARDGVVSRCCTRTCSTSGAGRLGRTTAGDHHLDRAHLPPPAQRPRWG